MTRQELQAIWHCKVRHHWPLYSASKGYHAYYHWLQENSEATIW